MFQSLNSNQTIRENYMMNQDLPSMIDSSDRPKLLQLGEYSKNSMLLTLFIPLGFLLIFSTSMDSVWSMYLMLQIVSNLMEIGLNRPGNVDFVLFIE